MLHFFQLGALILAYFFVVAVYGDEGSRRLLKNLFPGAVVGDEQSAAVSISALARPVKNYSDPVVVTLGLTVLNVFDLNFVDHSMKSYVWVSMEWKDPTCAWNQEEYGGVDSISMPPVSIWTPDLSVYNDVSGDVALPKDKVLAHIRSDGLVHWVVPVVLQTTCNSLDIEAKQQNCSVKFGSWIHDASKIELRLQGAPPSTLSAGNMNSVVAADISSVVHPVRGWKLQSAVGIRHVVKYACCPAPYNDVTYTLSFSPAAEVEALPPSTATTTTAKELLFVEAEPDSKSTAPAASVVVTASTNATAVTGIWNRFPSLRSFTWQNIVG